MKLIYTHSNQALVGLVKSMLENAGIVVTLKNEFVSSGVTGGANIDQEIWILDDNDLDKALEIIAGMEEEANPE